MRILYIGDIMASPGRQVVTKLLPGLRKSLKLDVVIAQAENVTHGKGMSPGHMQELQTAGVDIFSGGNHSPERRDLIPFLNDPEQPILRPANMNSNLPGRGYFVFDSPKGKVLVISLMGQTFPTSYLVSNPLVTVDELLKKHQTRDIKATVVNIHGDLSSDKKIVGYYLDGRVSLVVGDHWHVPTADAQILPKGTAHITDVGMCGTLHSSLGVEMKNAIKRLKEDKRLEYQIATEPPFQLNAVMVDTDEIGLAKKIEQVQRMMS